VPKRLIDLDDEQLKAAKRELGTAGVSDTVWAALRQAARSCAIVFRLFVIQSALRSVCSAPLCSSERQR